ncbi:MAG: hypothetical protein JXA77_10660 [Bacteroidales bacterium]|nr:hypothetical protein [Bacteroidales bacterium]MBN2820536.1 hypothetical protein [Bacteroidales bacterium]
MKKKDQNILKKAIRDLPEFKLPKEEVWANIDKVLSSEEEVSDKTLPEFKLPRDIWPGIEQKLNSRQIRIKTQVVFRVAAAIIILVGSTLLIREYLYRNKPESIISYSTEVVDEADFLGYDFSSNSNGDKHIQAICKNNPGACSSELFIRLSKQINDISSEMDKISEMIKENNDPQLKRYYYQLENQKVEIELQMIKIINRS